MDIHIRIKHTDMHIQIKHTNLHIRTIQNQYLSKFLDPMNFYKRIQ